MWKDWEKSEIGVHDVKFPKNQFKNIFLKNHLKQDSNLHHVVGEGVKAQLSIKRPGFIDKIT